MALYGQRRFDSAIPLAERALTILEKALGRDHPDVATVLNNLAELYRAKGDYATAEPLYQRALTIREKALGREHPDVANSLNNLAELYRAKGDYATAEPLYQRALTIREKALGREHPDVAASLHNLAALYMAKGDYGSAEPLYQRAVTIREKALGREHPDVATSLNNLADLHRTKGDYATAEPLHQRALTILEKALGREHPDVAQSLNNLAVLYMTKGDYASAEPLCQRALTIREKALGREHPAVAQSLNNLAGLYMTKGDYATAEPLYHRAITILEKTLGREHPDVAQLLNNLALLHMAKGDYATAEPLYQRALPTLEKALGREHPDVASSLNSLATLYMAKGDYATAEPLYQRALTIREKSLGREHSALAQSLHSLATLYMAKGDYASAEPLYQRALTILEKALGREHPALAQSLNNLAVLYMTKGDYASAEPLCRRALAILEKALGREHPGVARSLNNLALLYMTKGDYATSEPLYHRALTILEKALGREHPDVAASLNNLADLHRTKGDYATAERLHQRAVTIREKALGREHPDVATSLNNLATLYMAKGDYATAERLHQRALTIRGKALGREHPDLARSLHNLAMLYKTKGDYASAEPLYHRALTILEKVLGREHPDVATSHNNLATLHLAHGDTRLAIRMTEQAANIEDRNAAILLTTGGDEQKRAYMATLRGNTNIAVSLHVQFASTDVAARRLALTTILRRKGRVLDAMTHGLAALRRRAGPEDRLLLDKLSRVSAELSTLTWRGPEAQRPRQSPEDYNSGQLAQYRKNLARLDAERQTLEAEIGRRSPELKAELSPVSLAQVQVAVPDGAALVEFFRYAPFNPRGTETTDTFWDKARYVVYVLRHGGDIAWADLGEVEPIEDAVGDLRKALARAATDPRPAARALDALVMQPIRRILGPTRRVLLSPDGSLNLVPFSALLDENGRYLVERYAFTYLPSGRDLVRLRATAPARQGAFVFAAPNYDRPAATSPPRNTGDPPSDTNVAMWFPPLASAAEEGRALGRQLPGAQVLLGADATEHAVKALHGPRLLHIVTHGFFLPDQKEPHAPPQPLLLDVGSRGLNAWGSALPHIENPLLRSGLAFAGANRQSTGNDNDDGILTALEASQLDLNGTKLVVLAACETGVGDARSGDGVYGLRRALVMAGAETQVMSLWKVRDDATRELMQAYYDRLLAGGGRGEALRQAQLAMLANPDRAHPFFWASFIASGNDAALDGKKVDPSFASVRPPPGCSCDLAAQAPAGSGAAAALLAACALARRRPRRGAHRERRLRLTLRPTRSGPATAPASVAPVVP
ncbi:tetratricopeptide repeat protein [Sorangium sp. So ce204]|uniref:CHAT domain-containing tetratricopeptide repeat protein n=1 Tax=Sorangium sp. So ce204 TaxID=3133288 RepID=UPI003F5F0DC3